MANHKIKTVEAPNAVPILGDMMLSPSSGQVPEWENVKITSQTKPVRACMTYRVRVA